MQYLFHLYIAVFIVLFLAGCVNDTPVSSEQLNSSEESSIVTDDDFDFTNSLDKHRVSRAEVVAFQPAGDFGGGVLAPGTFFPPTGRGESRLLRRAGGIKYKLRTTGLPPGAYTNWMVVINNPEECDGDCDDADVFGNPATNSSVFWVTGGVVDDDGRGKFRGKVKVGEISSDPAQHIFGPGLINPEGAEIHIIVKYHGPVSDDDDDFYLQTHTLTGLCDMDANAFFIPGLPFGEVQCFDPQLAIHKP